MEKQMTLGESPKKIQLNQYKSYQNSVGNNLQSIQIMTKYRYKMMKKEKIMNFCKIAIEEACKNHKIEISILKVMNEHVHLIVDCPRTMSVSEMIQIIKGLSAYILFRICPNLRLRYPKGHFWSEGYSCVSCGSDFERAYSYIENQDLHHA
jgi:putative transposase